MDYGADSYLRIIELHSWSHLLLPVVPRRGLKVHEAATPLELSGSPSAQHPKEK